MNATKGHPAVCRLQIQLGFFFLSLTILFGQVCMILLVIWRQCHVLNPEKSLRILRKYHENDGQNFTLSHETLASTQYLEAADPGPMLWDSKVLQGAKTIPIDTNSIMSIVKVDLRWVIFCSGVEILHISD